MKLFKKLIPAFSALSVVGIVAPTLASCSKVVSFEWTYSSKPYKYTSTPMAAKDPMSPAAAILDYYDAVEVNRRIIIDDFIYQLGGGDPSVWLNVLYLKMVVNDVTTVQSKLHMSIDWSVQYFLTMPVEPHCVYTTNVKVTNLPFVAGKTYDDPYEKGVLISPSPFDELRSDDGWNIDYYYEESSPIGIVQKNYVYNSKTLNKYPLEELLGYILPTLMYNSRYMQNVVITD